MLKEFREFVVRGNVVDLAVGIVIGAAFGKIVTSFVGDVLMPPLGMALGKVDFSSLFVDLSGRGYATLAEAKTAGAPTINYGVFLQSIVDFLIVAFVIFLVIRQVNRFRAPAAVAVRDCPECLSKIPLAAKRCAHCASPLTAV